MQRPHVMRVSACLALLLLVFLSGCIHTISKQSLARADRSLKFSELQKDPDAHRGKLIIVGGVVAGVRQVKEGAELEVVEYPLDNEELPDTAAWSEGSFLVVLPSSADMTQFKPGAIVTMAGEVTGKAVRSLKNMEYTYPVLVAKEIYITVPPPGGYPPGYR